MVGLSDTGPLVATLVKSLNDFSTIFGTRQSYSPLYDSVEVFFREGGNQAYISRVTGPSATYGFHNLVDGGAVISLIATAVGPGAWSANYKVAVVAGIGGGTFAINVTDVSNNVLEASGDLLTQTAAIQWSQFSKYIRLTLGSSSNNPAIAAAAALSAGTDDRANITDNEWAAAIALFSYDLGPGQILAPGRITTTGHTQLVAHAESNNRVALIDLQDTATVATLDAAVVACRSRFAAAFAPWVVYPGLAGGTVRTVPPSALIAGLCAKNDPSLGTNRPSAGVSGISSYAIDLSQPSWTDTNRQTLNSNGVNVIRRMFGGIRVYGWRSTTDPVTDVPWIDFGNSRLFMDLSAELNSVGENFVFAEIDGQNGTTIGSFHDALAGVLLEHFNRGELFGNSADQAFSVDTGNGVNTLVTIAALELHAVCAVRMSPFAEYVQIEIVKRQITQSV
jgi:phage tail sheath protein FI